MAQSKFYETEKKKQISLLDDPDIFNNVKGGGKFKDKSYDHILVNGIKNLHSSIQEEALEYFKENEIAWWNGSLPTGNVLSSQIACLNHLMPIRNDEEMVLALINNIQKNVKFTKILPVTSDKSPSFIGFEIVSEKDHLNEGPTTRGTNCTSIDALVYAEDENSMRWIIPIEWKYTENYSQCRSCDKSIEDREGAPKGNHEKGLERQRRYNDLIASSNQLKSLEEYESSIYYFEPFYQLMRQTLWAEQMIKNKVLEKLQADNFMHLHVVPKKNSPLLHKKYKSNKNLEETWRDMINDQTKYILVDPRDFLLPIKEKYPEIWNYLEIRYFT